MADVILVTGATGTIGRYVVQGLARAGVQVRAFVRNAQKAADLKAPNVDIVVGDLDKPETIKPAMDGVSKLFLLTPSEPRQVAWQSTLIDAARQAGVRDIVKLSARGADPNSPSSIGRWHGETEKLVEASGIPYTHLRPHTFMQNFLGFAPTIKNEGAFYAPLKDAKVAMVDVRDIADVAVAILTGEGHEGQAYEVTGPEAISYHQAADHLSEAIGKPVQYVNVSFEDFKQGLLQAGLPDWYAEDLTLFYKHFSTGKAAKVADTVRKVAKKPGITFAQFAKDYAGYFK